MLLNTISEHTFYDKTTGGKNCRAILQHWLESQDPEKVIWAEMSYAEIDQDILLRYKIKISASTVAILLPGLVAQLAEETVDNVLAVRQMIARENRRPGAKVDAQKLEVLRTKLNNGDSPKQCAYELGLHYNTVLKYRHVFEMEDE